MEDYLNTEITAKYGDQLLSIMEKMTNSEVSVIVPSEDKSIILTKDEYVSICKQLPTDANT